MTALTFTSADLRREGFEGFVPLVGLNVAGVPAAPGAYVVVRESREAPAFSAVSVGGRFKGRDPTVPVHVLAGKWIPGTALLYIGKANDLRRRLKECAAFGASRPVGHWGGRYIWQLSDAGSLVVAWKRCGDGVDPFALEHELLGVFSSRHGRLPFANIAPARPGRQ